MHRAILPLSKFNPAEGKLVRSPERAEPGYWVGCPGILHEAGRFWMTYRQRHPRGVTPERGWSCHVAVSDDGLHFEDVWSVTKAELNSSSMERFSLVRDYCGTYTLYLSYVDPADNRWRIDAISAPSPDKFDLASKRPVLTAASTGTEGVKDPYLLTVGPVTYLLASYAAPLGSPDPAAHATADIYNVGATTHPTGLATSLDGGQCFTWHGAVLTPSVDGWDRYQARINSVVPLPAGGYLGFYDGSASHLENYEERTGIAVSTDLFEWHRISVTEPWLNSGIASGSVRYLDALLLDGQWWLYYEMTRADCAHELRVLQIPTV